jgi:hypothetical protein
MILVRGNGDDAELWEVTEECVADVGTIAVLFGRNHEEIGGGPLHVIVNVRLVCYFTDNFDIGLICERCEDELSHEPRTICHEDPNNLFHCALPEGLESVHQVDVVG